MSLAKIATPELTASTDKWVFVACRDRTSAREWMTRHAHGSWVHSVVLSASEYWGILKRHRFFVSPSGLGVQSPKTYASILAGAVPICNAQNEAYRRLRNEGWPIVIECDCRGQRNLRARVVGGFDAAHRRRATMPPVADLLEMGSSWRSVHSA